MKETPNEVNDDPIDSQEDSETEDVDEVLDKPLEAVAEEQDDNKTVSDDEFDVDVKLDDVPDPLRKMVGEKVKEIEKSFKSAYTKKTMSLAEQRKQAESETVELKGQLAELTEAALEVLRDPDKLAHWRKQLGFASPEESSPQPKKDEKTELQTVDDLLNLLDARERKLKSEIESKLTSKTVREAAESRWQSAVSTMESDETFKRYQKIIIPMAVNDPGYKKLYRSGASEVEVLRKVVSDFNGLIGPDIEKAKNAGREILQKRRKSSTLEPSKTVPTTKVNRRMSADDKIVLAVRETLGSLPAD